MAFVRRLIVLFTAIICSAASLTAQETPRPTGPGKIGGIVVGDAGQPLTSAAVQIRNAADSTIVTGTMTKADGRFRIEGLAFGKYIVRITHIGFKSHNVLNIVLSPGEPLVELGQMKLAVAAVEVDKIEATAQK